jgi:hypothetical protein
MGPDPPALRSIPMVRDPELLSQYLRYPEPPIIGGDDLQRRLINVGDMDHASLESKGRVLYRRLYLDNERFGVRETHDGQTLLFHGRQFDHAFFTSSDRICHPERKDILRPGSLERILWIDPTITGIVEGSACFEVPSPTGRFRPPNRIYAVYCHPFVVWLEPRTEDGWKFSSAYPCSIEEIHGYTRRGRTVWKWKRPHD